MKRPASLTSIGTSLLCLIGFAIPCEAADLSAGAPISSDTVLIDNEVAGRNIYQVEYADNQGDNATQSPGLVANFSGNFSDAQEIKGQNDYLAYNGQKVDFYTWPASGAFVQGRISAGSFGLSNGQNGPFDQPASRDVQCGVSVKLAAGASPPSVFPLTQFYEISESDPGVISGRDRETKLFEHTLRLNFAGGFIQCKVGDDSLFRRWTAADVLGAFGSSLSLNLPGSSDDLNTVSSLRSLDDVFNRDAQSHRVDSSLSTTATLKKDDPQFAPRGLSQDPTQANRSGSAG